MHRPPAAGGNVNGSHAGGGGGVGPPQLGGLFAGGMPKLKKRSGGLDTGGKNHFEFDKCAICWAVVLVMERTLGIFFFSLPLILMHTSRWLQKIYPLSLRQNFKERQRHYFLFLGQ